MQSTMETKIETSAKKDDLRKPLAVIPGQPNTIHLCEVPKPGVDGPGVWRRSVYVYRRRGLAFPMFQVFDLPEQNVTAGARTVSTVPTQALTLLNDPFVLRQAQLFDIVRFFAC